MADGGFDARIWLTIIGIFVAFFGVPGFFLEYDRRKQLRAAKRRDDDQQQSSSR